MEFGELVKRFAAAAASGDGDALADLFTADGTYDDYFFGPCSGREAIKKMLAHFAEGGRNFRWEFFDPVVAGNIGYASYRFSFEATRPEAKGARVAFDGIGRFDLEGGRIKRYSEVFDRGMALAQQAFEPERLRKIAPQVRDGAEGAARMGGACEISSRLGITGTAAPARAWQSGESLYDLGRVWAMARAVVGGCECRSTCRVHPTRSCADAPCLRSP